MRTSLVAKTASASATSLPCTTRRLSATVGNGNSMTPPKQRDSFSRRAPVCLLRRRGQRGGAAFRPLEGPGAEIGRLWLSTTGVIQEIL
jgi:hypothetical protein